MRTRVAFLTLFLLAWALLGCSALPPQTAEPGNTSEYQIWIRDISVEPGVRMELTGTTTLPEGNCVYTQLAQDSAAVDWWPVGKCFPVSQPEWSFAVPLGAEGAPQNLEPEADYCIRVWWPGAPSVTLAEYHFNLTESTTP